MISYIIEAISSLASSRLRSLLAILGLMVGVAAVISIQILGHATAGAMAGIFQGFSDYTFYVQPNVQGGFDLKSGLSMDDVARLSTLPNVDLAIAFTQIPLRVFVGHENARLQVAPVGGDPRFFSQTFAEGRSISDADIFTRARVCVISSDAAEKLSTGGASLLGKELRAGPVRCQIIGVLSKPPKGAANFNFAPDVSIPYTLFDRLFFPGSSKVYAIQVLVKDPTRMSETEDAVKTQLSDLKNAKFTYQSIDSKFFATLFDKIFGILTLIVGVIGSISLVVAGIGIMNVLLVSVAERTREIGIRKAIGAHRKQILAQFFIEAVALTTVGCTLGTMIGIALGWWINDVYIIKISGVIVPIAWQGSVLLAIVFVSIVSLAFGIYPAYRAAKLDPIEALRYE